MSRLTEKTSLGYWLGLYTGKSTRHSRGINYAKLNSVTKKLGQLEDIEEWIEKGLYLRFNGGIYYFKKIVTDFKMIGFCTDRDIAWYYISDYGKMFALTNEELL